ncbi:MAG: T9SS type A sorting domain-containing protein [bacterium]|nr:T9SS type A sorting domain-containing protein [bacterium]
MKKSVCLILGLILVGSGWCRAYAIPEVSNIKADTEAHLKDPRKHPGDITLTLDLSDTEEEKSYGLEVQYRGGPQAGALGWQWAALEEGSSDSPGVLTRVDAGHRTLTWQSSIDEGGASGNDYTIRITPYDSANTNPGISAQSDTFSLDNQHVKSIRITSTTGGAELELHGTKIEVIPGAFSGWFSSPKSEDIILTVKEIIKGSTKWAELRAEERGLEIKDDDPPSYIAEIVGDVLDDTYREFRITRNSNYADWKIGFTSDYLIMTIPYTDVAVHEIEKEFRIYGLKTDGWVMPEGTLERLPGVMPTEGQFIDTENNLVTASIPSQFYLVPYYRIGVIYAPDFRNVVVYPNPYKPYDGQIRTGNATTGITFINLPEANNQIKIYNLAGELVQKSPTTWVSWTWDAKNDGGEWIESGVYFYVITNEHGEVKTGKLAVIR